MPVQIVPFDRSSHQQSVIKLWESVFGYEDAHNDPLLILQKKQDVDDGLFFVSLDESGAVTGTVMCGYDGHRGWIYSLAVHPEFQRRGIGTELMTYAESTLEKLGCMKINLQIVQGNEKVQNFYTAIGFSTEERVSMGKRLPSNIPNVDLGADDQLPHWAESKYD
ncbi:MAG: GNAT family acetyltransferase [Verrucomicrobiales bacterium]|nr:GNAT family acetyltransferase [Verrucomicrobiales bacterium]